MRGIIVTGGSRGIGRAIVHRFAAAGDRVLFTCVRGEEAAAETATASSADYVVADVRDDSGVAAVMRAAEARLQSLDVLVNNAGIYPHTPFAETSRDTLREILEVNVVGPFRLMQAFAQSARPTDGRAIVNVTSINAFASDAGLAAYDASKAALTQATRTAALELGPRGIRVNAVAPGLVDGPQLEKAAPQRRAAFLDHAPLGRLVAPDDVAEAVFFLASSTAAAVTGQTLVVDAGVTLAGYTAGTTGP